MELVANVVRHVGMPMTVRLARRLDALRGKVDDPSGPLLLTQFDFDEERPRAPAGAAIGSGWGTEIHRDAGKTVWSS